MKHHNQQRENKWLVRFKILLKKWQHKENNNNTDNDSNKKNVAKKRSRKKWSSDAIELNLLDFINHRLMNGTIILNLEKPKILFYHFF